MKLKFRPVNPILGISLYFYLSFFISFLIVVPTSVFTTPALGRKYKFVRRFEISKRSCTGSVGSQKHIPGMCMFNFQCHQKGGEVMGACIDGFLFGACCRFSPEVLEKLLSEKEQTDSPITLLNELQNAIQSQPSTIKQPSQKKKPQLPTRLVALEPSQSNLVMENPLLKVNEKNHTASSKNSSEIVQNKNIPGSTGSSQASSTEVQKTTFANFTQENQIFTTESPSELISSTIINKLINDLLSINTVSSRKTTSTTQRTTSVLTPTTENKIKWVVVSSSTNNTKNKDSSGTPKVRLKGVPLKVNDAVKSNESKTQTSGNETLNTKTKAVINKGKFNSTLIIKKEPNKLTTVMANKNITVTNNKSTLSTNKLKNKASNNKNISNYLNALKTKPATTNNNKRKTVIKKTENHSSTTLRYPPIKKNTPKVNKQKSSTTVGTKPSSTSLPTTPTTIVSAKPSTTRKHTSMTLNSQMSELKSTTTATTDVNWDTTTDSTMQPDSSSIQMAIIKSTTILYNSQPNYSDPLAIWTTKKPNLTTKVKSSTMQTTKHISNTESIQNSFQESTTVKGNGDGTTEPMLETFTIIEDYDKTTTPESLLFWTTRSPVPKPTISKKNATYGTYILIKNGTLSQDSLYTKNNTNMYYLSGIKPTKEIYENVLQQIATNLLKSDKPLKNTSAITGDTNKYPMFSLSYDVLYNNTVPVLNPSTSNQDYIKIVGLNKTSQSNILIKDQTKIKNKNGTSVQSDKPGFVETEIKIKPNGHNSSNSEDSLNPFVKPPLDMDLLMQLLNLTSYIPEAGIFIPPHLLTTKGPVSFSDSSSIKVKKEPNTTPETSNSNKTEINKTNLYSKNQTTLSSSTTPISTTFKFSATSNLTEEMDTTLMTTEASEIGSISTTPITNTLIRSGNSTKSVRSTSTTTTSTTTTRTTTTTKKWNWRKTCGVRPLVREGRIVNGKRSDFGEWPWQALVRESTWLGIFTKNKCGGVLLNDRYVLTAAHCQPGFLASLIVVLGELDVSGEYEPKRTVNRKVKRVVVHRDFVARTFDNDLALLELESPIEFDEHILPICLPNDDSGSFVGRTGFVSGWGRLSYQGSIPNLLHNVEVPVIPNGECQDWFKESGHSKEIKPEFICAGYQNGKMDSCEGDSGGPLSVHGPDGRWILAGIVSHGIKCAYPKLPGVYMRMTYYKPWILRVIDS